jgi:hypothetical protein
VRKQECRSGRTRWPPRPESIQLRTASRELRAAQEPTQRHAPPRRDYDAGPARRFRKTWCPTFPRSLLYGGFNLLRLGRDMEEPPRSLGQHQKQTIKTTTKDTKGSTKTTIDFLRVFLRVPPRPWRWILFFTRSPRELRPGGASESPWPASETNHRNNHEGHKGQHEDHYGFPSCLPSCLPSCPWWWILFFYPAPGTCIWNGFNAAPRRARRKGISFPIACAPGREERTPVFRRDLVPRRERRLVACEDLRGLGEIASKAAMAVSSWSRWALS